MKKWSIGVNDLYNHTSVWIEEGSAWVFWLEGLLMFVCDLLPHWKIPVLGDLRILRDEWEDNGKISFNEKYGTIRLFFCVNVHCRVLNRFTNKYKKVTKFSIDGKEYDRVVEYIGYKGYDDEIEEWSDDEE